MTAKQTLLARTFLNTYKEMKKLYETWPEDENKKTAKYLALVYECVINDLTFLLESDNADR